MRKKDKHLTAMYIQKDFKYNLRPKYDEADSLVRSSGTKSYFQAQMAIFKGIIEEKEYHDYKLSMSQHG